MGGPSHRTIHIHNTGLSLHVVEEGSGPAVLLLHGFPETSYSWRHQMSSLAGAGFHVIAPDMRGYGASDAPESSEEYTSLHIVGDIIGLLDTFNLKEVYVVGHNWGAIIGWDLCLFRPDRVKAYVAVSLPFLLRGPHRSFMDSYRELLGEGFYMTRFQEPGGMEAEFASVGTSEVLQRILASEGSFPICIPEGNEILDLIPEVTTLPPWCTEEDLKHYTEQFEQSGFTGPLNYYRAINRTWELKAPWTNMTVLTTTLFISGDKDLLHTLPNLQAYVYGGAFQMEVPNLKGVVTLEGGHFIHQQQAAEFNDHVIKFFKEHPL